MKKLIILGWILLSCSIVFASMGGPIGIQISGGGTPAPAGGTPDFGGTVALDSEPAAGRWEETASGGTTVIGVNTTVGSGNSLSVAIYWQSSAQTLTSVTDSQSNTYTISQNLNFSTTENIAIAHAYLTTGLGTSDTITITWGSAAFTFRAGSVIYQTNCASSGQPDQSANGSAFGTAISAAAATTSANTHAFGLINTGAQTYSSSNWTQIGAVHSYGSRNLYYVEETFSSSGSKDPGGTASDNVTWGAVWVALD